MVCTIGDSMAYKNRAHRTPLDTVLADIRRIKMITSAFDAAIAQLATDAAALVAQEAANTAANTAALAAQGAADQAQLDAETAKVTALDTTVAAALTPAPVTPAA